MVSKLNNIPYKGRFNNTSIVCTVPFGEDEARKCLSFVHDDVKNLTAEL